MITQMSEFVLSGDSFKVCLGKVATFSTNWMFSDTCHAAAKALAHTQPCPHLPLPVPSFLPSNWEVMEQGGRGKQLQLSFSLLV